MLLSILFIYLAGIVFVGFPTLAICCEQDLFLSDEISLAIIVFYPIVIVALLIYATIIAIKGLLSFIIVIVALLIYATIIAIKGLLSFIILLFKGEIF